MSKSHLPPPQEYSRIDRIPTENDIGEALGKPLPQGNTEADAAARAELEQARVRQRSLREHAIKRYQVACMAYIGAMVREPEAVTAVWDRIVEKWLEGKLSGFQQVSDAGQVQSFRLYLKSVLRNEVFTYWRELKRELQQQVSLMDGTYEHADELNVTASQAFDHSIQDTVLCRAMECVRTEDRISHLVLDTLTKAAAAGEKAPRSRALAEMLSTAQGAACSEENARTLKKRAKQLFARKIIEQVGTFIESTELSKIEAALADWGLLPYCEKELLKKRGL